MTYSDEVPYDETAGFPASLYLRYARFDGGVDGPGEFAESRASRR